MVQPIRQDEGLCNKSIAQMPHSDLTPKSLGSEKISRSLRRLFAGVFLILITPLPANATKYYVDSVHGSDTANGLSPQTAWQHLSVVNHFASERGFGPGAEILLKRGCRWLEQIELLNKNSSGALPNSGTAENPIIISSYGVGDFPTLDGADVIGGWVNAGPGVFKAAVRGVVYKVFVDGDQRQTQALITVPNFRGAWMAGTSYEIRDYVTNNGKTYSALDTLAATGQIRVSDWYHAIELPKEQQTSGLANVARTAGSWYLDSEQGIIFVHLQDGSDPTHHAIQISRRKYGIELQGVNHVVIDGVRIIHAAKSGVLAAAYATNRSGIYMTNEYNTVRNSIFWNEGDISDDVMPGTGMRGEGAIFVAASGEDTDNPLRGWVIEGNAVGAIDSEKFTNFNRSGIMIVGTDRVTVRDNYVATNDAMGVSVVTDRAPRCTGPIITNNFFTSNQGNLRISGCTDPIVDSNTIEYSYGYGIQTGGNSSGALITHNLIHHLTVTPKGNSFNGFDCNGGSPGGTLAYNTIYAVWAAEATLEVGCDHWNVHDNVFDSSNNAQKGGLTLYIRRESLPGMVFEKNTYDVDPNVKRQFNVGAGEKGALTFHDYAWWQQNMERSALLISQVFADPEGGDFSIRNPADPGTSKAHLPLKPFVPSGITETFLKDAPKAIWQPKDNLR